MKKRVLITGGMGFIGRNLVRKLLATTDYDIVILDNLSTCYIDATLKDNHRVSFINADFSEWEPAASEQFDYIYHLAGPVGPVKVLDLAGQIAPIIISQLEKAAHLAVKNNAKLMFISTSEVYGTHAREKLSEHVNPIVPAKTTVRLEYGIGKLLGEIMLKNLSTVQPLKYNCVRPFNIVGPGQNDKGGFVIPRFLRRALNGEPITVYGDGSMVRTFTHVEDFVDAIVGITESEVTGEVFNIGNPEGTMTILELATQIRDAVESKSEIELIDPKKLFGDSFEEAWDKIPDIAKLNAAIGWKPQWSVERMMEEIAQKKDTYLLKE